MTTRSTAPSGGADSGLAAPEGVNRSPTRQLSAVRRRRSTRSPALDDDGRGHRGEHPTMTSFGQLPRPQRTRAQAPSAGSGSLILAALLFVFALWPRAWIIGYWIFGKQLGDAYDSAFVPAIGFFIAPWTTVLYAWMWAISSNAVTGWEWLVVGVGALLDLWFLVVAARLAR